ncbi:T9SS type A sorting domain-containing protein [Labilibacter sediminis]|nr:T9SS type A sorting domain-containing protein [Labilibacter sediminis]
MKRITFLLTVFAVIVFSLSAQIAPPSSKDVYLKHTQTGTVNEVSPYSTGLIYVSTDGSNDIISYTLDGTTFTDAETLELGTAKGLSGWADSDVAIYLGNNSADNAGVELRKLVAGTASLIEDYNPTDQTLGAGSGVLRYNDGSDNYYHFALISGTDMFGGATYSPAFTDETSYYELFNSDYAAQVINSKMHGVMFNNSLYYAGTVGSGWISNPGIFEYDGTNLNTTYTGDSDQLFDFIATSQYMYFLNGFYGDPIGKGKLYAMNSAEEVVALQNSTGVDVMIEDEIPMQILNDKLYTVALSGSGLKLAEINGTTVKYFHLNAEDESDNIVDMVVSGNYVYVLASKTGGNTELYAINPSRGDAELVLASGLGGNYGEEQKMLTAINGGVAFISVTGSGDYVFISDGNDGNTKVLMVDQNPVLAISNVISTGGNLYLFSDNVGNTDVYEYVVAAFPSITKTVTVQEAGTGTLIEGGSVKFDTGLEIYSGTTNASGVVDITAPYGYANATITATGYAKVEEQYYFGDFSPAPAYELSAAKSFAFVVYDETQHDQLFGGGELEGALVELTDGSITYSTSTLGDLEIGFANFEDVLYGTYNYTISKDGFEDATGAFTVDASTEGGPSVGLTPVSTNIEGKYSMNIQLFPNPAIDILYIESEVEVNTVDVYNLAGSLVKSVNGSNINSIQVSDLQSGVYVVKIKNIKGIVSNIKVQKQ